ncbi:DEAD-box ATP-dependent RNA helicase 45 [Capsicum baccatum]|uniref:RNA helicase n=1 Tax=Capsicum baccatum TaxID=33114 RepID=A0A2G2VJ49_CAPBA|nr:DEAD-box ATP-dependent RNA helicase 45 [Capsicum baccatum]
MEELKHKLSKREDKSKKHYGDREDRGRDKAKRKEREKSSKIRDEYEEVRDKVKEIRDEDEKVRDKVKEREERERKREHKKDKEDREERERKKEHLKDKKYREEREREKEGKKDGEKDKEDMRERKRERERVKEDCEERERKRELEKVKEDRKERERRREREKEGNCEKVRYGEVNEKGSGDDEVDVKDRERKRRKRDNNDEHYYKERRGDRERRSKTNNRLREDSIDQVSVEKSREEDLAEEQSGEEPKLGKTSDDEDAEGKNGMDIDLAADKIDPLDAFMNSISMDLPEVEKLNKPVIGLKEKNAWAKEEKPKISKKKTMGRMFNDEDSDSDYGNAGNDEDTLEEEDDVEVKKQVKKTKVEKLSLVDHSKIDYPPFRKNFYKEVKEISRMSAKEVSAYREQLELIVHGKDVPKPFKTWHQTGLSDKMLNTIKSLTYEKPMPIQAQVLPIIMSGRDCIGIAKTGSGKTLAFVLPMLRHIMNQPSRESGDGPIGLIMAPTRELVQQIHSDIKKFARVMGLTCVPVYGGRMIDILCTSGGKITNLRRVTYLVMDEADRMFDMGFESRIASIVQNTQPDRQTVLFSATFPRQVEILARKVLNNPVKIQVGGRSVVKKDITQLVEVRPESDRFLRLLELLGEWCEKGKILIFVHTQEECDSLFRELIKHCYGRYGCASLHGAKDQIDRKSTIFNFKNNICNLLIATSIAARGLDVKELELIINYDVPNHYEDYVHRVGRTGRAGRKGCAITFISEDDARYAPDLVKALQLSEQVVPDDLKALADSFRAKVNQGLEQAHGTGYGGRGFKFNEEEDEVRRAAKKAQAKEYGFEEDKSDSEDDDEGIRKAGGDLSQQAALAQAAALDAASKASMASAATPVSIGQLLPNGVLPVALPGVLGINIPGTTAVAAGNGLPVGSARALNLRQKLAKIQADAMPEHYIAELEINDFPQNARWKATHKATLDPISEWTGAAITPRGQYAPPGKVPESGQRKLYLFIEGPTEQSVMKDITMQASSLRGSAQSGRYSVV